MPFPPPFGDISVPAAEVQVWLLDLDQPAWLMSRLRRTLDAQERERAGALVFRLHRERYTAAHGLGREVLAGYLGIAAAEVTYQYGQQGKPYLDVGRGSAVLQISSSRSAHRGLFAVSLGREVGVDIERIRQGLDHRGIAERYFSPAERAAIQALPAGQRVRAFYDCWTRKEAQLKATGRGLSVPLHSFTVPVTPDPPPAPVAVAGPRGPDLAALPPIPGFAAALAVAGDGCRVVAYHLRGRAG